MNFPCLSSNPSSQFSPLSYFYFLRQRNSVAPLHGVTLLFQQSSCLCILSTGITEVCPMLDPVFSLLVFLLSLSPLSPPSFLSSHLFSCVLFGWHKQALYHTVHRQMTSHPAPPLANRLVFVHLYSSENYSYLTRKTKDHI